MVLDIDLNNQKNLKPETSEQLKNLQQTSTLPDDVQLKFDKLINDTINAFKEYDNSVRGTGFRDENDKENEISMSSTNDDSGCKTSPFEKFNSTYNKLLTNIRQAKQTQYFLFMNIFRKTNSNIIRLYEFAAQLLNLASRNQLEEDQYEQRLVMIKRTIELLHCLITSR